MIRAAHPCRGFVLTGGESRRMGRDKALLPFGEHPLAVWMAKQVETACGTVSLVGDPEKYSGLGFAVLADLLPGQGPLGGIHAALARSEAYANLVVGCDLPYLSVEFLKRLLAIAEETDADAVIPESPECGYEPLCAVYTLSCRSPIEKALRRGQRKVSDVLASLRIQVVSCREWKPFDRCGKMFRNLNTPEDYEEARRDLLAGGGILREETNVTDPATHNVRPLH